MTGDTTSFVTRRTREIKREGLTVPLGYEDLKREAAEHLPTKAYDYAATGAGTEDTIRANRAAFRRHRIVPRVFRDISERDLSTPLLDRTLGAPVGVAPVGGHGAFHDEGELASARAAAELDVPFVLSTGASRSIEAVAEAGDEVHADGDASRFFQLYWPREWSVAESLVGRAEAAGYDAIVLTLDSQLTKWRRRNLRNDYSLSDSAPNETLATDPAVQALAEERGVSLETVLDSDALDKDATLTWADLAWLKNRTDLPVVLKGILHPEDAKLAVEHGADGVIVSSHGGRQIDGERGAVAALPDIVTAVEDAESDIPVMLDSGVRTGADVFKALALGADYVFVGRPFVFGLAIGGQRGVYEVLANLVAEFDSILGLSGHTSVGEVGPHALVQE